MQSNGNVDALGMVPSFAATYVSEAIFVDPCRIRTAGLARYEDTVSEPMMPGLFRETTPKSPADVGYEASSCEDDGAEYTGELMLGKRHGAGRLTLPDGSEFVGQFVCGDMHGAGLYTWFDGRSFEGQFAENMMHGKGVFTFGENGHKYEGEYRRNKREGFGIFHWGDGTRYEGDWIEGKLHGRGKLIIADGQVTEGTWHAGTLIDNPCAT